MSSRRARRRGRCCADRRTLSRRCSFELLEWRALLSGNDTGASTSAGSLSRVLRPGDLNFDGQANVADLSVLMSALVDLSGFQSHNSLTDSDLRIVADLNGDGQVNNADIGSLIGLFA